jgi:hypothetical protein
MGVKLRNVARVPRLCIARQSHESATKRCQALASMSSVVRTKCRQQQ